MLGSIAILSAIGGGLLWIIGERHFSGRLLALGIGIAFVGPVLEQGFDQVVSGAARHGCVLGGIAVLLVLGSGIFHARRLDAHRSAPSTSRRSRIDNDA